MIYLQKSVDIIARSLNCSASFQGGQPSQTGGGVRFYALKLQHDLATTPISKSC